MIQVVVYEKRRYINEHKDFKDREIDKILEFIDDRIRGKKNSIIEINKWDDKTKERK